jgi:hypothetical protein
MATVEGREVLATRVEVSEDTLSVELADGRTIAAPLAWYPRQVHATAVGRRREVLDNDDGEMRK